MRSLLVTLLYVTLLYVIGTHSATSHHWNAPDHIPLPVQHQLAVIGQAKVTHFAVVDRIGGPLGLFAPVVHDQVAISLHDQATGIRAGRVGRPGGLPVSVDDKVAVLLPREQTDRNSVSPVHRRAA